MQCRVLWELIFVLIAGMLSRIHLKNFVYLLDQPTVYGELVRACDTEGNDVDNNSLTIEASDGFSVANVDMVRKQTESFGLVGGLERK